MKKLLTMSALLLGILTLIAGCGTSQEELAIKEAKYHLYSISADETELIQGIYEPKDENSEDMLKELMHFLKSENAQDGNLPLLPADVSVNTYSIVENTLTIDFNGAYSSMSKTREVLTRAGVVRLFAQVPDIKYVKFTVEGKDLLDSTGMPLSIMNEDTFVEYSGEDINSFQYATINLYFTNKDGSKLIPEEREVRYNSNIPLERVVVEQLMSGPTKKGSYPTLPANMTILGVTTDAGNVYVNLDSAFLDNALTMKDNTISIYSIANSLADDCQTEKVQISVNGETDVTLRESVKLNQFFLAKPELVVKNKNKEEKK